MRTVIVGGGRIGKFLAKELEDYVIIERERVRAENLARELGEEHVIIGDGSNPVVLEKAGTRQADALLAITNHDQTNLKVALAAKAMGVPKVIARCDDPPFIEVMRLEGVDNVICPAQTASRMIHSTLFHDVEDVASIHVTKGSKLDGVRLGEIGSQAATRVLGVIRKRDVLKPDPDLVVMTGDEILLCSIGGMTPELTQLIAQETDGLLPFLEILVVLTDNSQIETVGDESIYLSAHMGKVPVSVHCPAEDLPERMNDLAQTWGVPVHHSMMTSAQSKDLAYLQYLKMSKGTLVALAPGKITDRGLFKKCELEKILGLETARVLLCRRRIPYSKILAVFDGTEGSMDLIELALKVAIHTGSSLYVLDISESEGAAPDLEHLKKLGRKRNVEVKDLFVEGNPTLDLVALVTGGEYDLLAIRWSCQNVRRDILRKVVSDSKLSVLLDR